MTGNPLWDFIAFDQLFNSGGSSRGSGGGDDTLGAIVGSIAEVIWGIPKEMRKRAMDFLPLQIQKIIDDFESFVNRK